MWSTVLKQQISCVGWHEPTIRSMCESTILILYSSDWLQSAIGNQKWLYCLTRLLLYTIYVPRLPPEITTMKWFVCWSEQVPTSRRGTAPLSGSPFMRLPLGATWRRVRCCYFWMPLCSQGHWMLSFREILLNGTARQKWWSCLVSSYVSVMSFCVQVLLFPRFVALFLSIGEMCMYKYRPHCGSVN